MTSIIPQLLLAVCLTAALAAASPAGAQDVPQPLAADTLDVPAIDLPPLESAVPPGQAPAGPARNGGLEHPINFAARDSLVIVFAPEGDPAGDVGTLYGDARTEYEEARLTAFEIDLLFQRETLRARGLPDDTSTAGRPAFQRADQAFTGRELAYNLATQRGRIAGVRTVVEDGYVLGGVVTQVGERLTYAQDVVYTTCEYEEHQHWGLHAHRMKVVDGKWIYTGPARLHILGIPTPLWLPFGFFPAAEGRRSGALPLDYGEQSDLGFFVRNIGYYWALSDYFDLQLAGGIYTSGSYETDGTFRYARRYAYDGALSVGLRSEKRGEPQDPLYRSQLQSSVNWRHNQTLDAAGTARLSGNVQLRSTGFARSVTADYDQRVNQSTNSNLTLSKRWASGRNVNLSYSQQLNLTDGSTNITLPSLQFNQPRWFPFRAEGARGSRWHEQISLQYSGRAQNTYRFRPLSDTTDVTWLGGLFSADAFQRATGEDQRFNTTATHNIPLAASFSVTRLPLLGALRLDINPSVTYREEWFSDRQQIRVRDDGFAVRDTVTERLQFDTQPAFTAVRQASLNVSASTRVFGTFPFRVGAFDGFRHEVQPSVSFRYAPDYSGAFWGRATTFTEPDGNVIEYSVRQNLPVQARPQQSIDLSINNVFQGRRSVEDTTGAIQRRVIQLLTANVSTGYDFAADSLNWRDVGLSLRSTIAEQVNIQLTARYSPYAVDGLGNARNRLYFTEHGAPLRFVQANLSASTQLRAGQAGRSPEVRAPRVRPPRFGDLDDPGLDGLHPYDFRRPDLGYVDFSIPWSLSLDLNYGITRNFRGGDDTIFATINSSFDFGLTREWRISGRTGYDFDRGEIVPTQIGVLRELHCWEMAFNWLPFGTVRAFSFSIYVKSGHLRDLLRLDVPNVDRTQFF